uniref:(S)-N-methylcoclaurine 3'-hydroxylase isozyme 2 n=1 Tax=Nelumbo nucifera TaxID=4432 RepID=A0A822ZLK5_NELNU|nr:TPA_asm: hypothetical protein HUJ06_002641 [Nelumbo nucifera]
MGEVTVKGGAEFNISFLLFLLLLLLIPLFVFFLGHIKLSLWKASTLPPGPYPWPVIGNILDMGKKPHISLAHFAKIHGPVISLRLGTQLLVVGSSPAAAAEILKTHDALLSARHVPQVSPMKDPKLNHLSLAWAFTCNKQWKLLRNFCRAELFSSKAIESQVNLREKKVKEMLCFLGRKEGKIVKIGELVWMMKHQMKALRGSFGGLWNWPLPQI